MHPVKSKINGNIVTLNIIIIIVPLYQVIVVSVLTTTIVALRLQIQTFLSEGISSFPSGNL